jgi:hypothetical protein
VKLRSIGFELLSNFGPGKGLVVDAAVPPIMSGVEFANGGRTPMG